MLRRKIRGRPRGHFQVEMLRLQRRFTGWK